MGFSWHKCRITPRIRGVNKDPVTEEDPKADDNLGMPCSTSFPFLSYIYKIWKKGAGLQWTARSKKERRGEWKTNLNCIIINTYVCDVVFIQQLSEGPLDTLKGSWRLSFESHTSSPQHPSFLSYHRYSWSSLVTGKGMGEGHSWSVCMYKDGKWFPPTLGPNSPPHIACFILPFLQENKPLWQFWEREVPTSVGPTGDTTQMNVL